MQEPSRNTAVYQMMSAAGGVTDVVHDSKRRIVLTGKAGGGKSATGNTILNTERFPSQISSSSVTKECRREETVIGGRRVTVIDTPDLLSAPTDNNDVKTEIEKFVSLCSPGVHAFLFILTTDTFTKQELDVVSQFEQIFGEDVFRYTIIIFTNGDKLKNRQMNRLIRRNFQLLNLINRCGRRYQVFNNKDPENRQQVTELLQRIDSMVSDDGNSCYTLEMLQEAERRVEEQRGRVQREHQRELERVRSEPEVRVRKDMEEKSRAEMLANQHTKNEQMEQDKKTMKRKETEQGSGTDQISIKASLNKLIKMIMTQILQRKRKKTFMIALSAFALGSVLLIWIYKERVVEVG